MSETSITIVGNIACSPENRNTTTGKKICKITVASSQSRYTETGWVNSPPTYFDVECWDSLAVNTNASLGKGMGVIVVGHFRTDSWIDSEGKTKYYKKIVAKYIGPHLKYQTATVEKVEKNVVKRSGDTAADDAAASDEAAPAAPSASEAPDFAALDDHGDSGDGGYGGENRGDGSPALVGAAVGAAASTEPVASFDDETEPTF